VRVREEGVLGFERGEVVIRPHDDP
jgi:hypothetical protein